MTKYSLVISNQPSKLVEEVNKNLADSFEAPKRPGMRKENRKARLVNRVTA